MADAHGWLTSQTAHARLGVLEEVLEEMLECGDPELAEIALLLVRRGGKRLRPTLLFVTEEFGGDVAETDLLRAAGAIELLHIASLYHDDVMDGAELRRGASTANAAWSEAEAITAGTFIFSRAVKSLLGVDVQLARWATECALALALGQFHETENSHNADISVDAYIQTTLGKTAALFELPCRAGAYLSGADDAIVEMLGIYGRALGLAFQIVDDVLDITGDGTALGKSPGTDLAQGVYGLPVILALNQRSPSTARLRGLLEPEVLREAEVAETHRLVIESGGVMQAFNVAYDYARQAADAVRDLPSGRARDSLVRLTDYAIHRQR